MKPSSHTRVGLLTLSAIAAIWAAGCSDDDDRIPGYWNAGGQENLGGTTAVGGSGATSNGGTTPQVTGGTVSTTSSTVPQAGNAPNAGAGNTPTIGGAGTTTPASGGGGAGGTSAVNGGAPGAGAGPVAGASSTSVCPTTLSSFTPVNAVFSAGSVLPVEGFKKGSAAINTNPAADAQIVTTPELCSAGCLKMSGTFVAGDAGFNKTVSIERPLTGAETNLVGAKVIMRIAVDNPSNVPIFLGMFAPGTNPASWGASAGKNNAALATYEVANGFSEFVWDVADMKDWQSKQFCAASASAIGLMLQTGASVPSTFTTPTPVSVYIQSIEIRPAGYVPTGTGGASGMAGAAGAAGAAGSG